MSKNKSLCQLHGHDFFSALHEGHLYWWRFLRTQLLSREPPLQIANGGVFLLCVRTGLSNLLLLNVNLFSQRYMCGHQSERGVFLDGHLYVDFFLFFTHFEYPQGRLRLRNSLSSPLWGLRGSSHRRKGGPSVVWRGREERATYLTRQTKK